MDYLTIDMAIEYLRLVDPPSCIKNVIKKAINKAEQKVYAIIGRNYSDIIEQYGEIPKDIKETTLLLTEDIIRRDGVNYAVNLVLERYKKEETNSKLSTINSKLYIRQDRRGVNLFAKIVE